MLPRAQREGRTGPLGGGGQPVLMRLIQGRPGRNLNPKDGGSGQPPSITATAQAGAIDVAPDRGGVTPGGGD